ncbi:hypothetical protein Bbelb_100290, partial [Branchiostoma belcheri]
MASNSKKKRLTCTKCDYGPSTSGGSDSGLGKSKHPVKYSIWESSDSGSDEDFRQPFMENKKKLESKRRQYNKPSITKKKKTKSGNMVEDLKVAILQLGSRKATLNTVHNSCIGVTVPESSSADTVRQEAERKMRALRKIVDSDGRHILVNKEGVPFCCDPDDEVQFKGHGPTASCSTPNDTTIPFFEVDVEDLNEDCNKSKKTDRKMLQEMYDRERDVCHASMDDSDQPTSLHGEREKCMREAITDLKKKNIKMESKRKIFVQRDNVWNVLKDRISRKSFDPTVKLEVQFIGEEETIDMGGPTNEMFRLAFREILTKSGLFEESTMGYLPTCIPVAICRNEYKHVGIAFSMAIVNLAPIPNYLHPSVVDSICGTKVDLTTATPTDPRAASFVEKLDKATNETLSSILETEEGSDMLEQAGWTKPTRRTTMEMIPLLRRALCYQDIIMKRKPAIDQLTEGLATLGLLDTIQRDPLLFGALLRYTPEEHRLTADSLLAEFKADYSEEGSSRKHRQMAIVEKLSICLTDIEDEG